MLLFLKRDGRGREDPKDIVVYTDLRIGEPTVEQWVASLGGGQVEIRRVAKCRKPVRGRGCCCTQEGDEDEQLHGIQRQNEKEYVDMLSSSS